MDKRESTGLKKIVITGPESTGKTTLTRQLGQHFQTVSVAEYARDYVEKLKRPYNYNDVLHIADKQREQFYADYEEAKTFLFFDTYLIITKVWFNELYSRCPQWINEEIAKNKVDLYLICDTDLPWVPDSVRENPGKARKNLFEKYLYELEYFHCRYRIVTGKGNDRFQNALSYIEELEAN